jgi:hypothetical protein
LQKLRKHNPGHRRVEEFEPDRILHDAIEIRHLLGLQRILRMKLAERLGQDIDRLFTFSEYICKAFGSTYISRPSPRHACTKRMMRHASPSGRWH